MKQPYKLEFSKETTFFSNFFPMHKVLFSISILHPILVLMNFFNTSYTCHEIILAIVPSVKKDNSNIAKVTRPFPSEVKN